MPSSHLILCRPLLFLPPILPSIRVFSNEFTLRMRWPKYWSFSFSISPSRTDLLLGGLVASPCSPRDSQESFPVPQFKSINSSVHSPVPYKVVKHKPESNTALLLNSLKINVPENIGFLLGRSNIHSRIWLLQLQFSSLLQLLKYSNYFIKKYFPSLFFKNTGITRCKKIMVSELREEKHFK